MAFVSALVKTTGKWAAAGFKDTLLRCQMKKEVANGDEKKFSREFKLEAVKMVKDRGVAARQVSRDLDINENMLRRWIKELSEDPHEAFPGLGNMKTEQAEIARLQGEVAKLKVERDILKKAAAYFAKESM